MRMLNNYDTICAPLTVRGESAVAVVRISGPDTYSIVSNIVKTKDNLKNAAPYTIKFGYILLENGNILDKVLISCFRAPHSFTGEDSIEISTHGSPVVVDKLLELLIQNGARLAKEGEFTKRAFINGKMSLSEAESVIDLIEAKSDKVLNYAVKNLLGELDQKLNSYTEELLSLLAKLNLAIDFDEEFVEDTDWRIIEKSIEKIIEKLDIDIENAKKMLKEKRGIVIVLAGAPNVGKSTLLNRLLNKERAIVSEIAGTTRDYISEELVLNGHHVRIYDTAGLREDAEHLEAIGIRKTKELIDMADIVVHLFDGAKKIDENELVIYNENAVVIPVVNKSDIFERSSKYLKISAQNGENVDVLIEEILKKIEELTSIKKSNAVIINQRQLDYMIRVKNSLLKAKKELQHTAFEEVISDYLREAINNMEQITGKKITESMLDSIFSRFCIGK